MLAPYLLGLDFLDPQWLIEAFGDYALWGVLFIVFAECGLLIGFFLPGDSLLFTAGLLIAQDIIGTPLWLACAVITIAAVAGNLCGYWIGRTAGPSVFNRPDSRLFKQEYVDKTFGFFDRYGNRAIVLARFVPIVRTFITVLAGVGKMDFRRYALYSTIGGILWGTGVTVLGYFLGRIEFVRDNIEVMLLLIVLVSVLPIGFELWRARAQGRDQRYDEPHERDRVIREDISGPGD
ncbi:MAG TPA: VTT domain-containing protein [Nocardioidaceae bacterium]|nr:VTT domain-containing protein [Actinomycetota bacterium]MDQ3424331.1 VTT domain-containing protein [Actinomycetota bacterium]HEV8056075.1 VTT domain-containing protein [Nocardioidaceae bacterium]